MSGANKPSPAENSTAPSPLRAGLLGRCPACGLGCLYDGVLSVSEQCSHCEFPLRAHDAADGPAFFAMTLMGLLVVGLAAWLEIAYAPPVWLHMVLWVPVIVIGSLMCLRVFKGLLIAYEYQHRADSFGADVPHDPTHDTSLD